MSYKLQEKTIAQAQDKNGVVTFNNGQTALRGALHGIRGLRKASQSVSVDSPDSPDDSPDSPSNSRKL